MDLAELLKHAVESGASDLHLTAARPPMVRLNGRLLPSGFPDELAHGRTGRGQVKVRSAGFDGMFEKFCKIHSCSCWLGV